MFRATLYIIAKTCKQPKCPSLGEWINKLWYMQTKELYTALKRKKNQVMKRHGEVLHAYYKVKEANLKSSHAI